MNAETTLLSLFTFLLRVVTGVYPPLWDLYLTSLTPGEGVGVLLQDPDLIHPVLHVEV